MAWLSVGHCGGWMFEKSINYNFYPVLSSRIYASYSQFVHGWIKKKELLIIFAYISETIYILPLDVSNLYFF